MIDVTIAGDDGHWDHADIKRLIEYRDQLKTALREIMAVTFSQHSAHKIAARALTAQETNCESTNPGGTGLEQSPSDCGDGRGDSGLTPGAAGGRRAPGNAIAQRGGK